MKARNVDMGVVMLGLAVLATTACSSSSETSPAPAEPDAPASAPPGAPPTPAPETPPPPAAPPADAGHDSGAPGSPFAIVDQIFYGGGTGVYEFKLTSYPMACALQQASNTNKQNSKYWKMAMTTPSNGVVPPGKYTINVASNGVTVLYAGIHERDATCTEIDDNATSGSVTVTSATKTSMTGTIDVVLPMGGAVSVPFSAAFCDTSVSTGPKECIP